MVSIHVDIDELEWMPGSTKYGTVAIHDGKEIIQSKILSDRRQRAAVLHYCPEFHHRRESLSKLSRSPARMNTSSTSRAAAAQNPASLHAALAATRSTRKGRCIAP
jgi:hypothetical protein